MGRFLKMGMRTLLRVNIVGMVDEVIEKQSNDRMRAILYSFLAAMSRGRGSDQISSMEVFKILVFSVDYPELHESLVDAVFMKHEPQFGNEVKSFFVQTDVRRNRFRIQ